MDRMDAYAQLESLLELAEQLGLKVRRLPGPAGEGDHPGGALTRLKGQEVLFLDPQASVADQLAVTAAALAGRAELEDRYVAPELRAIIERFIAR
jgi:hypothetical protein